MRVGIDFDNTLACSSPVFYRVACERGLVSPDLPPTKEAVQQSLRDQGREAEWTELQGAVYGPRLSEALPFVGAREFVTFCRHQNINVYVISHKTPHAVGGPAYDLHDAGHRWLERHGFYGRSGLSRQDVFFEPTRPGKLNRIRALGCSHFIDDLEEVFAERAFPEGVKKWLFASVSSPRQPAVDHVFSTWRQIERAFKEELRNDAG